MNWTKILSIIGGVSTLIGVIFALLSFYDSLATDEELNSAKNEIVTETRREIVKNRSVMISAMQREADDLQWEMSKQDRNSDTYRYMADKYNAIMREIERLKSHDE